MNGLGNVNCEKVKLVSKMGRIWQADTLVIETKTEEVTMVGNFENEKFMSFFFFSPFYCPVLGSVGGEKSMCTQMAYPADPFNSITQKHPLIQSFT